MQRSKGSGDGNCCGSSFGDACGVEVRSGRSFDKKRKKQIASEKREYEAKRKKDCNGRSEAVFVRLVKSLKRYTWKIWSSEYGSMVDASELSGEEGRGKLRKAAGRSKHPVIRG